MQTTGQDVTGYIGKINQDWQAETCRTHHACIHQAIPDVTERLMYGKPHYYKNGQYACVLGTAQGWVSFTIFNAASLDAPDGLFEPGPPERRTVKIRQGQAVDYDQLTALLQQAATMI